MKWYKKAKLINIDPPNVMNLGCAYCGRWATNFDEMAKKDKAIWKKPSELDEEERASVKETEKLGASHGLCPYCLKVMMEMRNRRLPINNIIIRQLSLKMV